MNVDEIVGRLKHRGLRITPQRAEVVRLLLAMSHPTADQLYARMHETYPHVSHATIYNTLKMLKDAGIVSELAGGQRVHYYELTGNRHGHFTCKRCGGIFDMETTATGQADEWAIADGAVLVRELPMLRGGFRIEECRIELAGVCPSCQAAEG